MPSQSHASGTPHSRAPTPSEPPPNHLPRPEWAKWCCDRRNHPLCPRTLLLWRPGDAGMSPDRPCASRCLARPQKLSALPVCSIPAIWRHTCVVHGGAASCPSCFTRRSHFVLTTFSCGWNSRSRSALRCCGLDEGTALELSVSNSRIDCASRTAPPSCLTALVVLSFAGALATGLQCHLQTHLDAMHLHSHAFCLCQLHKEQNVQFLAWAQGAAARSTSSAIHVFSIVWT